MLVSDSYPSGWSAKHYVEEFCAPVVFLFSLFLFSLFVVLMESKWSLVWCGMVSHCLVVCMYVCKHIHIHISYPYMQPRLLITLLPPLQKPDRCLLNVGHLPKVPKVHTLKGVWGTVLCMADAKGIEWG